MKSFALVLTAVALLSQASAQPQSVIATVTNKAGQYVQDLKQEDFILEENGVRQQLTKFSSDSDVPVSLGILIDKSTSMRLPVAVQGKEKVPVALPARRRCAVIIKLMKPQDEYLIMDFDEKLSVKQAFTPDKKKVTDLLYKNNLVGGSTHLYHAVGEALKEIKKKAKYPRRALVVITDVHDTSGDQIEELQATIREQEIPVFTFGMRWDAWGVPGEDAEPGRATYEEAVLRMMASESAGQSMVVDIPDLLSDYTVTRMIEFVTLLGVELRGQYTLSYNSSTPSEGRTIRIRTSSPDLQVRFRPAAIDKKK
jgi:VWFA-related protein